MQGHDLRDPDAGREWIFADDKVGQELMARSPRFKLLWSSDAERCRFFDLEADPHELHNRLDDPACADEVARHRAALSHWTMFEALAPTCLDFGTPTAPDSDVPQSQPENREKQRLYSEKKFAEYLASSHIEI